MMTPQTDERCGWWETLPQPTSPPGSLPASTDVAIIGAGVTGLAAAVELARLRPSWTIAIVDALRVGQGPAGRNSGFVVDLGHYQPGWRPEGNKAIASLARIGIETLERNLGDARAAVWSPVGRYHVAVNRRGERALDSFRKGLDAMDEPFTELARGELSAALGTSYYARAIRVEGGALVQPAAMMRALAARLPPSVTLVESQPVHEIESANGEWTVTTSHGALRAPRLVLATNGFTRWLPRLSALRRLRGRVVPLHTFASLTRRLTDAESDAIGGLPEWGAVPEEKMGTTLRRTRDNRILLRNGVRYTGKSDPGGVHAEALASTHRRSLMARFPTLAEVELEYTWGGILGMTLNNGSVFGELEQGLWAAIGHNGVGLALGTALGTLLAGEVVGEVEARAQLTSQLRKPSWMPPDPFLGPGLTAYVGLLQSLARAER